MCFCRTSIHARKACFKAVSTDNALDCRLHYPVNWKALRMNRVAANRFRQEEGKNTGIAQVQTSLLQITKKLHVACLAFHCIHAQNLMTLTSKGNKQVFLAYKTWQFWAFLDLPALNTASFLWFFLVWTSFNSTYFSIFVKFEFLLAFIVQPVLTSVKWEAWMLRISTLKDMTKFQALCATLHATEKEMKVREMLYLQ